MKTIFVLWFALCLSAGAALPGPAWLASATKAAVGGGGAPSKWIEQTAEEDNWSVATLNWSQKITNDTGASVTITSVSCMFSITGTSPQYVTNEVWTGANRTGSQVGKSVAVSCSSQQLYTFTWSDNNPVLSATTAYYLTFSTQYGASEANIIVGTVSGGTRYGNLDLAAYRGATVINSGNDDLVFNVYKQ